MEYFRPLQELLALEKAADREQYHRLTAQATVAQRRADGLTWYPVAIRDTEVGKGDYLTIELERTTHQDISHQLRFGAAAALFSNHEPGGHRLEGVVAYQGGNTLRLSLRVDELPDWTREGKLGVDLLFDDNSYDEMEAALKTAAAGTTQEHPLVAVLTGARKPSPPVPTPPPVLSRLNTSQQEAVQKILDSPELAIVHGPPGTGKTTTLVQAIHAMIRRDGGQVLVTAPSNAAVDLLSERLSEAGLRVLRVGNPARVSEKLSALTLDSQMAGHSQMKEIKRLKKQAGEYRNMAHKYKRQFGKAERDQRKALFDEAHKIMKEVARTEQYITDDLVGNAQVIAATLVGANHYTVRRQQYGTVVIDEAGQALEPACWIPLLKARKAIFAGDHLQLPPTLKSPEAERRGLGTTLMEKCVQLYPQAVVLLEEQYRMHEMIMGYPARYFYENRLRAHSSVAGHTLFTGDDPMVFIDTAGCGFEEKAEGTSTTNPEEAAFLIKHLTGFLGSITAGQPPEIAVIAPYKQQVTLLKALREHSPGLNAYGSRLSVNTVDSFQGQERDIVYISMTRSNNDSSIGFLNDIRRMNVAMTRARKKLVIVGDSATLAQHPFYEGLISYAQESGAYHSAWEFMEL